MRPEYNDELKAECAGWVAEQMAEEDVLIEPPLVFMILNIEEHLRESGQTSVEHGEMAVRLLTLMAEEGVRSQPFALDERLLVSLLSWEDEFLALAGIPRGP